MRIVVLIKQVPESSAVRMDEATGTMLRDGVTAILNPLDLHAVEAAVQLRAQHGGEVIAVSMGPPKAESALREAIAMGVDSGILLSDKAFAGSDTWATACVLAAGARKLGVVDLVLCGERATDGDTGQVGPGVAAFMDLPVVTYVARIDAVDAGTVRVRRLVEDGYELLSARLPAVLTVVKEAANPRLPTLRGKQRAKATAITVWGVNDLGLAPVSVGLSGSPTRVVRIFHPKVTRECRLLPAGDPQALTAAVDQVVAFLTDRNLLSAPSGVETRAPACEAEVVSRRGETVEDSGGGVWLLAEQADGRVQRVSHELITRGRALADKLNVRLTAVILGHDISDADLQDLIARGADRVLALEAPELAQFLVEPYAACLQSLLQERRPDVFIAGATSTGRTLMPYLAVKIGTGLTADCTDLDIEPETELLLQTRPAIGGNILATIKTPQHRPQMATVRPRSTRPAEPTTGRTGSIVRITPPPAPLASRIRREGFEPTSERHTLQDADVVVSVGRGLGKAGNLPVVRALADSLGAALGATRDAVDRGWLSYPHQVGLSGKTVTPRLYVAVGLSGSIQHLAGMQTAEHIVAINRDPDAQIFRVAEIGIVGDLFDVVPALTARILAERTATGASSAPSPVLPRTAPDLPVVVPVPAPLGSAEFAASSRYRPVTPRLVAELRAIVGAKHVIADDPELLDTFGHDEIADPRYAHRPEVVVRPGSAEEIAAILKLANREHVPVTPRGAGSGLSGGAVPVYGGVVLATDRLNRILEIDAENLMVVVEPGVVTNEINTRARPLGLFYAGYPMSLETCFVGGNVAENAGGGKAVKYGVTRRYVTGLEVVTPTGDIVHLGGKRLKDVTGYNLVQLMVGSEGTLGVFTKITLRLLPLPKASVDLLCLFPTPEAAIAAVPRLMTGGGVIPTAIEFMDQVSVRAACDYLNESIPYQDAGAMLLITVDGADTGQVEREAEAVGEQCLAGGATEVYVADNPTTSERIWKVRRNIAEAFKLVSPHQSLEDVVVPIANIAKMVAGLRDLAARYDITIPCYGHAGDGNLHATPVMNPAWTLAQWQATLPAILTDMYRLSAALGGTISGEHGIGHKRKPFMSLVLEPACLEMMRAIKRSLDPNNILNPGKIVDV